MAAWLGLNASVLSLQAATECAAAASGRGARCTHSAANRRRLMDHPHSVFKAAFSRMVASSPRRSFVRVERDGGHQRVVKQFDVNTHLHRERYFLEKRALCRLERCAISCAGRDDYFPRLLFSNDSMLRLVTSMGGSALSLDAASKIAEYTLAELHLDEAAVQQQFECMLQQLARARVVHFDITCKNVFARSAPPRAASLTLGDFDSSSVDDEPQRAWDARTHKPILWGQSNLNPQVWRTLQSRCFKRVLR